MAAKTSTKSTGKKGSTKTSGKKGKKAQAKPDVSRRWSILLFALGTILTIMAFVPGEKFWAYIRLNFLFGIFGTTGYAVGPVLLYIGYRIFAEKPVKLKIFLAIGLMILVSGFIHIFFVGDVTGTTLWEKVLELHSMGQTVFLSGGVLAVLVGVPLQLGFGDLAAKIIITVFTRAFLFLFLDMTPYGVYRDIKDRAREEKEQLAEEMRQERAEKAEKRRQRRERQREKQRARQQYYPEPLPRTNSIFGSKKKIDFDIDEAGSAAKPRNKAAKTPRVSKSPGRESKEEKVDIKPIPGKSYSDYTGEPVRGVFRPAAQKPSDPRREKREQLRKIEEIMNNLRKKQRPRPQSDMGAEDVLRVINGKAASGRPETAEPADAPTSEQPKTEEENPAPEVQAYGADDTGQADDADDSAPDLSPKEGPAGDVPFSAKTSVYTGAFGGKAENSESPWQPEDSARDEDSDDTRISESEEAGGSEAPSGLEMSVAEENLPKPEEAGEDFAADLPGEGDDILPGEDELFENRESDMNFPRESIDDDILGAKRTPSPGHSESKKYSEERGKEEKKDMPEYELPSMDLFNDPVPVETEGVEDELKRSAEKLVDTLNSFGVETRITDISRGPTVTRYELQPSAGVKISRITNLADDIALNLAATGVRIEAPIPGKAAVGIEVPNRKPSVVNIKEVLDSDAFKNSASPLTAALGVDIAGNPVVMDLSRMPHLLIAGSTGSGKSVCINSIIISFICKSTPEDLKLILIDPKVVELSDYNGVPHMLMPVVTDPKKAAGALSAAVGEMERRYVLFAENSAKDIKTYNRIAERREDLEKIPYIAVIIDELADLMMVCGKEVEDYICRLAQKARAAGIHLVVATQRPSVDVITGLIKANIPSRIAFAVASGMDSRTILDSSGAEKLIGNGDMLYRPIGANKPLRVQGAYVRDEEIERVLDYEKTYAPEYDQDFIDITNNRAPKDKSLAEDSDDSDEMLGDAIEVVVDLGQASTSLLQRKLRLGYARASRIMDRMEDMGIVGPSEGSKPRDVLITKRQWQEMSLRRND